MCNYCSEGHLNYDLSNEIGMYIRDGYIHVSYAPSAWDAVADEILINFCPMCGKQFRDPIVSHNLHNPVVHYEE